MQTPPMEPASAMAAEAAADRHWLAIIHRRRPNTSAMTPEGTSNKKLAR